MRGHAGRPLAPIVVMSSSALAAPVRFIDASTWEVPEASQPSISGDRQLSQPHSPDSASDPEPHLGNQRGTKSAPLAVEIVNAQDIKPEATSNPYGEKGTPPKWWPWPCKLYPLAETGPWLL